MELQQCFTDRRGEILTVLLNASAYMLDLYAQTHERRCLFPAQFLRQFHHDFRVHP